MPCNCDYLEPRQAEVESKRAAKLIVFVDNQMGLETPNWIKRAAQDCYGNEDKLNELVVKLCDLCTNMSAIQENLIIYNARSKTSRDLADWWDEHQAADKERIAEEKKEALQKKLKKQALSKLSKAERAALGVE